MKLFCIVGALEILLLFVGCAQESEKQTFGDFELIRESLPSEEMSYGLQEKESKKSIASMIVSKGKDTGGLTELQVDENHEQFVIIYRKNRDRAGRMLSDHVIVRKNRKIVAIVIIALNGKVSFARELPAL